MTKKQQLYLVFGGFLKEIGNKEYSNMASLEYVGIYDSLQKAKKAWKAFSIKNVDYANKKFKVVPLFNLFDPAEKIKDYLKKLDMNKIKIDNLSFKQDDDLLFAAKSFKKYNAGAGVVLEERKLCGIVTEKDIIRTISACTKKDDILETKLRIFMTKNVKYINTSEMLINAIEILKKNGFRHLPIYDEKNLKYYGIISYKDFILGNLY